MDIEQVVSKGAADDVIKFLLSSNTFHWQLPKGEQDSIKERVLHSIQNKQIPRYWVIKDKKRMIIGAGGIEKLPDTKDGYFLGWFAIHKDYRRQGLGRKIIGKVEEYAKSLNGRFMTIDTGDDNSAQIFYQKIGYTKAGFIPEYFEDKVGKVIYYKKLD